MKVQNIIIVSVLIMVLSCQRIPKSNRDKAKTDESVENIIPDREGWDATIRITTEGDLQAIIEYGHMTYFDQSKINYFNQNIQVDMFDKNGKHTTRLTAEKGEFHENTQNIWAIDHVIVTSDTGITLHTPIMKWDQRLEKIISDTSVMVTTAENDTIYGTSFESNADLTHMIIENPRGTREQGVNLNRVKNEIINPEPDSKADSANAAIQ